MTRGITPSFGQLKNFGAAIEMDSAAHLQRLVKRKLGSGPDPD